MKTFLAIYLGTTAALEQTEWAKLSEDDRKARVQRGMEAWHAWGRTHEAAIVENGGPLGKTKHVSAAGVADVKNAMTGYVVVRAESQEAAARMFENHPHFAIFPGEAVEIMEVLPVPHM